MHPSRKPSASEDELKAAYEIQLFALRALRVIYSLERNRKYFRKLFSHAIFGSFIDVGNYVKDTNAYVECLNNINQNEDFETLETNIEELKDAA